MIILVPGHVVPSHLERILSILVDHDFDVDLSKTATYEADYEKTRTLASHYPTAPIRARRGEKEVLILLRVAQPMSSPAFENKVRVLKSVIVDGTGQTEIWVGGMRKLRTDPHHLRFHELVHVMPDEEAAVCFQMLGTFARAA